MARLVRSRDAAGLVLDPDAAALGEAELRAECGGPRERGHLEAVPVDDRDALVEAFDQAEELLVRETAGLSEPVGVEEPAVADERVGLVAARELAVGQIEVPLENVVDVAHPRVRAAERIRLAGRHHGAASGADESAGRGHSFSSTPVRSFTSPISSSQPAARARCASQNAWWRRASNSSSGVPCCSTQVK